MSQVQIQSEKMLRGESKTETGSVTDYVTNTKTKPKWGKNRNLTIIIFMKE